MNDTDTKKFEVRAIHPVIDKHDDNIDVVVRLVDGSRWGATFITARNITAIMENYRETGECLAGEFFWAKNMIVVRELTQELLEKVVHELLGAGELESSFELLESGA